MVGGATLVQWRRRNDGNLLRRVQLAEQLRARQYDIMVAVVS